MACQAVLVTLVAALNAGRPVFDAKLAGKMTFSVTRPLPS